MESRPTDPISNHKATGNKHIFCLALQSSIIKKLSNLSLNELEGSLIKIECSLIEI